MTKISRGAWKTFLWACIGPCSHRSRRWRGTCTRKTAFLDELWWRNNQRWHEEQKYESQKIIICIHWSSKKYESYSKLLVKRIKNFVASHGSALLLLVIRRVESLRRRFFLFRTWFKRLMPKVDLLSSLLLIFGETLRIFDQRWRAPEKQEYFDCFWRFPYAGMNCTAKT